MTEAEKHCLHSYEENERLNAEIAEILSEHTSASAKKRKLKALGKTVAEPLSQSHVEYFLKKLGEAKRSRVQHFIASAAAAAYLVFTLLRVFWYYNPGRNPFPETNYAVADLIVFLYLIPVILAVGYFVRKKFR